MKEELKLYIKQNMEKHFSLPKFKINKVFYDEDMLEDYYEKSSSSSIKDYINNNNNLNKFQNMLFKLIDDRNLKDSDVYNKVHIDRRLFSKIRSDEDYHPSKDTIILLGLSLELSEQEIVELLDSASYSLPKNNYFDLIIRFCFINKIYKLDDVNNLLSDYNCKLFNY